MMRIGMNEEVREAVKREMEKREVSQGELAKLINVERPNLTRILSGRSGKIPKVWQEILDTLDMELVALPRKK